jgi:anti-sigma B factor antagonist
VLRAVCRLTVWDIPTAGRLIGRGDAVETFRIKAVPGDGTCTLVLSGEADLAVAADIVELGNTGLSETSITTLLVDLAAVTFIDSTSIGALVQLRNAADAHGKRLALENVPPGVFRVLELSGVTAFFGLT